MRKKEFFLQGQSHSLTGVLLDGSRASSIRRSEHKIDCSSTMIAILKLATLLPSTFSRPSVMKESAFPGLHLVCRYIAAHSKLGGNLILDPKNGPCLKRVGNCVIAIGFKMAVTVTWTVVRIVIASLLDRCFEAPLARRIGGMTVSTPFSKGRELDTPYFILFILLFFSLFFLTPCSLLSARFFWESFRFSDFWCIS